MLDKKLIYENNKQFSPKLNLLYNISLYQPEKNDEKDNKNPIYKLFSNLKEIASILNINDFNYIKVLYFNRLKVHKLLYEKEEIIRIENENAENYFFYVYLSLLIEENPSVVNYDYSLNLINNLNK